MRSTHACGVTPARAAAWITDWLCSSIPMRKWTASPRSRRYRAMQSAPTFSNGEPHLGHALEKVGADCIERVAQMRLAVRVVDRSGQVELRHPLRRLHLSASRATPRACRLRRCGG